MTSESTEKYFEKAIHKAMLKSNREIKALENNPYGEVLYWMRHLKKVLDINAPDSLILNAMKLLRKKLNQVIKNGMMGNERPRKKNP